MSEQHVDNFALESASAKAHQAEIILRLISQYPSQLAAIEFEAMTELLLSLVGNASGYLATEQAKQEASHA